VVGVEGREAMADAVEGQIGHSRSGGSCGGILVIDWRQAPTSWVRPGDADL
jgi:hypothetical protein